MNVSHRCNPLVPFLIAGLCGIALTACEPNSAPPQEQPKQAPAASEPVSTGPQAAALQKLDATALAAKLTGTKMCNLEYLGEEKFGSEATAPKNPAATEFSGWVGDETTGTRPADARLRFATLNHHQAWEVPVGEPVVRKDVAKYTDKPTLENAGFKTTVDLTSLPQGEYRVYLVYGGHRCDNGRHILR